MGDNRKGRQWATGEHTLLNDSCTQKRKNKNNNKNKTNVPVINYWTLAAQQTNKKIPILRGWFTSKIRVIRLMSCFVSCGSLCSVYLQIHVIHYPLFIYRFMWFSMLCLFTDIVSLRPKWMSSSQKCLQGFDETSLSFARSFRFSLYDILTTQTTHNIFAFLYILYIYIYFHNYPHHNACSLSGK